MTVFIKLLQSLMILLIGGLVFISSGLAFSINSSLKSILQFVMIALTLLGIGLTWTGRSVWAAMATGGVLLTFGLVLLLNR